MNTPFDTWENHYFGLLCLFITGKLTQTNHLTL
jgi:hypothetical protein